MEKLIYKSHSELKSFDDKKGIIEGYANVYNVIDSDGDVSLFGSFAKTVGERMKKIKIYRNHYRENFIGVPLEFDLADTYGLRMIAKLNMDTQIGRDSYQEARFLVSNGYESGLSVGGYIIKRGKNPRDIAEWKLNEVSLLTSGPANEFSVVDTIKSVKGLTEINQSEFWKVITKAYDEYNFSDDIKKSLEQFLLLSEKSEVEDQPTTLAEKSADSLIVNIYNQFI